MNHPFPFDAVWFGVDLGDIRPVNATYGGEAIEMLPPVDTQYLNGNFGFLSNVVVEDITSKVPDYIDKPFKASSEPDFLKEDPEWRARVQQIQDSLPAHLILPESLIRFMSAPLAQDLIPSCTACYFDLPDKATPFGWLGENGYIFHFYRDQQDCLFWYYYVRDSGESCIIVSPIPFEDESIKDELDDQAIKQDVFYTAASFDEFIYRTWIENILWFNMEGEADLDELSQKLCDEYVEHYRRL